MADTSIYDPFILIWTDETGCNKCNTILKYIYAGESMATTFVVDLCVINAYKLEE